MNALDALADVLPAGVVETDPVILDALARDASRAVPLGRPMAAVLARSTADVRIAVRWAARHRVPVSIRGAGTGLSGGSVGYPDGLVISLAGMRSVLEIDPVDRLAVVEPGVTVAELDRAAEFYGLRYGPDPASAETCSIGGSIATNAGGLRCVALGVTRDAVAGLEVVTGSGELLQTGSRTRKNSTGYDLTGLFVGSEGTLGVITRAIVRLLPRPVSAPVPFSVSFATSGGAVAAVSTILSAPHTPQMLELLDEGCLALLRRFRPDIVGEEGALLIGETDDPEPLIALCRAAGATSVAAGSPALLEPRRLMNTALGAAGFAASCDVAVPVGRLGAMLDEIRAIATSTGVPVCTFAHAGDGNLHPAIVLSEDDGHLIDRADAVFEQIADAAVQRGGVVSGEHGIGSLKLASARAHTDPVASQFAQSLRTVFDPAGVLTPGRAV